MQNKPQLFGTDGIRGIAGRYPLDRATVLGIGLALADTIKDNARLHEPKVLLGEDTRESSHWLVRAIAGGLMAGGAQVAYAGVIPTPGVAFLTRRYGFSAGVMVSASHNSFEDNGIKILSSTGTKLPESAEMQVEQKLRVFQEAAEKIAEVDIQLDPSWLEAYINFLVALAASDDHISRCRIVADCAHGAASAVIPKFLDQLGMKGQILNANPNGQNINLACGSLFPDAMAKLSQSAGAELGVAFDGDADRAIFASSSGRICNGDCVLFAMAPFLFARKRLTGGAVVGTSMTNLGLELSLKSLGIGLKRTPVGDKFVLEEMLRSGINLGGEPSGHIIFSDVTLAGDGIVTLVQMLRLLSETGRSMDDLVQQFKPFPQVIRNVRVREKRPLDTVPGIARLLSRCREELGERGRVVLRYSGTEPIARVMVEGENAARVEFHAFEIAATIEGMLGE